MTEVNSDGQSRAPDRVRQEWGVTAPPLRPKPRLDQKQPWHDPHKCQSQKSKTDSRIVPDQRRDSEKQHPPPGPRGHWIPLLEKTRQKQQVQFLPGPGDRGCRLGRAVMGITATKRASHMMGNTQDRLAGVRLATHSFSFPGTNRSFSGTSNFPVRLSLFEKQVWF